MSGVEKESGIIPYQELSGSYNPSIADDYRIFIIPYQELSGSYNNANRPWTLSVIIPYQELSGSYNNYVQEGGA